MKFQPLYLSVALLFCAQIEQPPKFAALHNYDNFIMSRGVWLPDHLTEKNELPPSATDVECYKHGGDLLVHSDAYCMVASAQIVFGQPSIDVTYYPVLSWDGARIVAADSPTDDLPICVWSQLTVNLKDKTISMTDNRKIGKGHEGLDNACLKLPLIETYHLVDEISEAVRRARQKAAPQSNPGPKQ